VRRLTLRPEVAPPWTAHTRRLIDENRWRAKRYGLDAEFIPPGGGEARPCRDTVRAMIENLAEDARSLGCEAALDRVRTILDEGTSAHAQLSVYDAARARGDTQAKALLAVMDWIIEATVPAG